MPKIHNLERSLTLPTDLDNAWEFISTPKNLDAITPDDMSFSILTDVPEVMYEGLLIEYRVGIPVIGSQCWLTEIKHIKDRHSFVDEQRIGPYSLWYHYHEITEMPLDPSGTYAALHKIFDEAHELSNPEGDPDPWLDLQGLSEPLWGHHSLRRMADTVARATMGRSGSTEQDIDLTFGWNERMYNQKMQYHYETRFNRDKRYRVTMYL